jgi:type I restriction enzyme R subunit
MAAKEAQARIKINTFLKEAGWRLLDDDNGPANVVFEVNVKLLPQELSELGDDFEQTKQGYVDFLLLDERGFPLLVLEAKSEDKDPLVGKEQARKYAKSLNCRFVILSNGNLHYFWDLQRGNPYLITQFPTPNSVKGYAAVQPNPQKLAAEVVTDDYIVLTQRPDYARDPRWRSPTERPQFIKDLNLPFLRPYQLCAVHAIQQAIKAGHSRFLFEMATGTGKTLTAAAVIKLFLRTSNAKRALFLVDRLELEDQAKKAFDKYLTPDCKTVIYKQNRDDWRGAEIVVTTVQSLLFNNKYARLFSPTDFDLVISDEAHRSIGGNARAVFEYFVGYKLGLTATPKDYLKKFTDNPNDPREYERRLLMDTYRTFGCDSGQPTFRYSLPDGVRDGYLINPLVVDARTEITTQLLSDEGYATILITDDDEEIKQISKQRDFERKFFSAQTNRVFCQTFLEHALRDPISGEIGKTIVFAVSQNHTGKLAQMLNELADQMALLFSDQSNRLGGCSQVIEGYETCQTRVCVTVGMMTTGYDCQDILNIGLMRPIFSPTDFVQIKGRGTRKFTFSQKLSDPDLKAQFGDVQKTQFKLFDFFANCEYFEEKYNYDQILKLPKMLSDKPFQDDDQTGKKSVYPMPIEHLGPDQLIKFTSKEIGLQGMKVDRMFFEKFGETIRADAEIKRHAEAGDWTNLEEYVKQVILDKPEEFFTVDKLRRALKVDRRVSLREFLEYALGLIPSVKSKDDLLEEEFTKFLADYKPAADQLAPLKYFFKAYVTDAKLRDILNKKQFNDLHFHSSFKMEDFKAVAPQWRTVVPEYVKDYVPLNQFL